MSTRALLFPVVAALLMVSAVAGAAERAGERRAMVEQLQTHGRGDTAVTDPAVLEAMGAVPRHRFVPAERRDRAYADRPLPIGHGQTISQPYIVALMTQLAAIDGDSRVLEVGTGSGYQAAVLSEIADRVFTIEIIQPLAATAAERFEAMAYDAIRAKEGDGYYGWPEHAPFDAIVVTAAAEHIPPPLIDQLAPDGRMIIPVGPKWGNQRLTLVRKDEAGDVTTESLLPVRFVPLTGDHGQGQ